MGYDNRMEALREGRGTARRRPAVLVTRKLPDAVEERLRRDDDARLNADDAIYGADELIGRAERAQAMLTCATDSWPAAQIARLPPSIRAIATFSIGYERIDFEAARPGGIIVTNTPYVVTEATADTPMLCLLGAARRAFEGEALIRTGWTGWPPAQLLGIEVCRVTLAIIGFGRTGQALPRRASTFGMQIRYHSRTRRPPKVE
jgi:lactate dehydrogenase-like 2-hydroxyacid dehydrogenase